MGINDNSVKNNKWGKKVKNFWAFQNLVMRHLKKNKFRFIKLEKQ